MSIVLGLFVAGAIFLIVLAVFSHYETRKEEKATKQAEDDLRESMRREAHFERQREAFRRRNPPKENTLTAQNAVKRMRGESDEFGY